MKIIFFSILALGTVFLGYGQYDLTMKTINQEIGSDSVIEVIREQSGNLQVTANRRDREEIQHLIRQMLKWANTNHAFDVLPVLKDSRDSVYIGFDLNELQLNLDKLRATGLFADEFIENYNRIILMLDKGLKNHTLKEWFVGELPPFRFAQEANPWCDCQDIPYDNPDPWDFIETEITDLSTDRAELIWKWGGIDLNTDSGWKDFSYRVRVVKENGKWKIAYLQGFDFEESLGKDEPL